MSEREETGLFRTRLILRITRPVRLHALHCPPLYATLAEAWGLARHTEPAVPDGVLLDAPEQCRLALERDARYALGFTILSPDGHDAATRLDLIVDGLRTLGRKGGKRGLALGGNFQVAAVEDLVSGQPHGAGRKLTPIPLDVLRVETARVAGLGRLRLRFLSPLRALRSKKVRHEGHTCFDEAVFDPRAFVQRLHARLTALGYALPAPGVEELAASGNCLRWIDVSYGPRAQRKALGGSVGRITFEHVTPEAAGVLVWGQYVRIGEKTRFGFGRYRIEDLGPEPYACQRAAGLLELAARSPRLDQVSAEADLESGVLQQAMAELLAGRLEPQPHTRVEITSAAGKTRTLAIPSRRDRALQRVLLDQIAPALDLFFEESSLAFRRGLGRHRAAARVKEAYRRGLTWAVRSDISDFFDSVPHDLLRERLQAYLGDDAMAAAVLRWVAAGAPAADRGLPTGSPLSPLLGNLVLDEFDEQVAAAGGLLIRYADDFLICRKSREEAEQMHAQAAEMAEALRLRLNEGKSAVLDLREPFEFLGFRFQRRQQWPAGVDSGSGAETGPFAGWEAADLHPPTPLDELGWREARTPKSAAAVVPRLPGESEWDPGPQAASVICGPAVEALEQQGGVLRAVLEDGRPAVSLPLDRVREVLALGTPTIRAEALRAIGRHGISLWATDDAGRVWLYVGGDPPLEDAEAVAQQVAAGADESWRLALARSLIAAKLANYGTLAEACLGRNQDYATARALRKAAAEARETPSVDQLLGIEGAGAARWYGAFDSRLPSSFLFTHRVAPHAGDPVNVLLNFAQTVLHRLLIGMIRQVGLCPALGVLHRPHPGHAALASDVQEPFRHLMDLAVIETLHRLQPRDFVDTDQDEFPLRLSARASRELLGQVHRLLATPCQAPNQSEPKPYRHQALSMIRALRTHLRDRTQPFVPFEHP